MRLIGRYASPFVRRVAVTMQVQGLPYTHVPMMPFGPEKSELTRFNPVARVPVLELDDGECLIDSMAILDHLESLVAPERALVPREGPERRHVLSRLAVMQGVSDKLVATSGRASCGIGPGSMPARRRSATASPGSRTRSKATG